MPIADNEELEDVLARPSTALIHDMARLDGDLMILGAAGKMGPSLARRAARAVEATGGKKRIIAVSRFSQPEVRSRLERDGIETIAADLLDEERLTSLPEVANIVYMAGMKFGTAGNEHLTWAMNAYLPGRLAARFPAARWVVFSTGNVYPLTPVASGGATEDHPTAPVGEYAQSCLGRERVFEHASRTNGTPMLHFRLNYATDLRYGVVHEVARKVLDGRPVSLAMGHANVIWQGDANDMALRSLHHTHSPPTLLNVTGPETVSIRWLALEFGERFGRPPEFIGEERPTALLSNAARAHGLFGYPEVPLRRVIDWTADWVARGGPSLDKPTHFEEREGRF